MLHNFSTTESAMNLRYEDEHEINNELVRTKTNSCGVSSYRVRWVRCYFFSNQKLIKILGKVEDKHGNT